MESQVKKEDIAVECSLISKQKTKVKYYRRKNFIAKESEGAAEEEGGIKSESVAVQTVTNKDDSKNKKLINIQNHMRKNSVPNRKRISK